MKFSIVIPVYNIEQYVGECLDSLMNQSYADWEAICVDDGSTDGSGKILESYAARDPRIRAFHQQNAGVGAARNLALTHVKGDWVWFVDGDDLVHPDALKWIADRIAEHPLVQAVQYCESVQEGPCAPTRWDCLDVGASGFESCQRNSETIMRFKKRISAAVLKNECIKDIKFSPYKINEDALYLVTCYWKTNRWYFGDACLYYYRTRPGSATHAGASWGATRDILNAELEMLQLFEENDKDWSGPGMMEYLRWTESLVYFTHWDFFFKLSCSERQSLLLLWLRVQDEVAALCNRPVWHSLTIGLTKITRSSTVCKFLALLPRRIRIAGVTVEKALGLHK